MTEKTYFCPSCNKSIDQGICPDCGTPALGVKAQPEAKKAILLPPAPAKREERPTQVSSPAPASRPGPAPTERERPTPTANSAPASRPGPVPTPKPAASATVPAAEPDRAESSPLSTAARPVLRPVVPRPEPAAPVGSRFAGEEELETYIQEGYEVFLVVGIPGAGKTELLASFRQPGFLDRFKKASGMVVATSPRTLNSHPIHLGSRKALFVDASGEDFRSLYPQMRQTGEITEVDVSFLRLISKRIAGVIALVDLERLWGNLNVQPGDKEQLAIVSWILSLLRWLTSGERYEPGARRFQDQVDASVMRMRARLKVPVEVLFSKADQLVDFPVPQNLPSAAWLRRGDAPVRKLYPAGEDPLLIAYYCLPDLYKALRIHADHFRFDFAHSLTLDQGSRMVRDPNACGIKLALEWLLDPCWQSRWPILPSRYWVDWQHHIDVFLGRGRRWQRLPDPLEVRP